VVAKATFTRVEHDIFRALWKWAKRRHPKKSIDWVRKKYFPSGDGRSWVFGTHVAQDDGSKRWVELYQLSGTTIQRHKKVRGDYHPFDPAQEMYGETLRQERMLNSMSHRKQWIKLYVDQRGLCALCKCKITKDTGWHDHHVEYRMFGGSDALGNRVLLHPNCHAQVHKHGLSVVKLDFFS